MSDGEPTVTLWRPVGPEELELIRQSGMRAFPPRLPEQPIFYPVLSEDYAVKIARDWNVPASGAGFVTRFAVRKAYLDRYEVQEAGGRAHREYWIPADELEAFNEASRARSRWWPISARARARSGQGTGDSYFRPATPDGRAQARESNCPLPSNRRALDTFRRVAYTFP